MGEPALVGQFEFLEWTEDKHLQHSRFVGLREDKIPFGITKEGSAQLSDDERAT
jgi:ATP-dependent DNA ligase